MKNRKLKYVLISIGCLTAMLLLTVLLKAGSKPEVNRGTYGDLSPDTPEAQPLGHLSEDYYADEEFSSHLPLVILHPDRELPQYKTFTMDGQEIVDEDAVPWVEGTVRIIDSGNGNNRLTDTPVYDGNINVKLRGHSSIRYAKKQYYFKLTDDKGQYLDADLLGMGAGNGWVLNGSMADKSMMRNYLAYRIASEIGGNNMAMDSRYCEVFLQDEKGCQYQGLYLLIEGIERGKARIDIENTKKDNVYTSYIVRRDRFTVYDPMLETYARLNGLSNEWIGVKYPGKKNMTPDILRYMEADFSHIEQILYAEDRYTFMGYDKLIDTKTFIDYFLINEFFGNYDAGEHSNYMYKNTGGKLCMGPVWDFDQAVNNSKLGETDPDYMALDTKAFYSRLIRDSHFVDQMKSRYTQLTNTYLSTEHIFALMDQIYGHICNARQRDWFRWNRYYSDSNAHGGNYILGSYRKEDLFLSRFNTDYDQEQYVMRTYFQKHSRIIQQQLTERARTAQVDSSYAGHKEILLAFTLILFLVPAFIINRRG